MAVKESEKAGGPVRSDEEAVMTRALCDGFPIGKLQHDCSIPDNDFKALQ
jgi:hypothetical protein